jgi:tetraprenyl-beta-curcumene synthase
MRCWQRRARRIPDPALRGLAQRALQHKAGNLEGACAFAVFAPATQRARAVSALFAFQALCDYLDIVAEQIDEIVDEPRVDHARNAAQLHTALPAALAMGSADGDYYAHCPRANDGGYLVELIVACQGALARLPSYRAVATLAHRLAGDAARFQSLNLSERHGGHGELARWASSVRWSGAELYWWEAAAANSTPGLLALLGAAARPDLAPREGEAIARAYRPWYEALHTLLDSVVDEAEDFADGQRSLLNYYDSPQHAAERLGLIASEALGAVSGLQNGATHAAILAAMSGFYLCPPPNTPTGPLASRSVLDVVGVLARPTVLMFRVRGAATTLSASRIGRRRSGGGGKAVPAFGYRLAGDGRHRT